MAAKSDPDFFKRINEKEQHFAWEGGKEGASTDKFTKPGYGTERNSTGQGRYKGKISEK